MSENNNKSKLRDILESEVSNYWGFALVVVMIISSVSLPFLSLKSRVSLLEQEMRYSNEIATNHLSEIEGDIRELKKNSKENREKLDQVGLDIAELKTLIQKTH